MHKYIIVVLVVLYICIAVSYLHGQQPISHGELPGLLYVYIYIYMSLMLGPMDRP